MPTSTRVHTEETSHPSPSYPTYRHYRESFCSEALAAAKLLYSYLDKFESGHRLHLLDACRRWAWFVRHKQSGMVHVASNSCRLRWCPICARSRSSYITHQLTPFLSTDSPKRFMTLTQKHSNAPLDFQIENLYRCFRLLRRNRQFSKLCSGGIWFFQVKRSADSQQWHPHLHCCLTGSYIPKDWLSKLWLKITKSSIVVDIKMIRNPEKVAEYVARYSASPVKLEDYSLDDMVTIFKALHGKRLAGTWGTAKGLSLSPPRYVPRGEYEKVGMWSTVHEMRVTSNEARAILKAYHTNQPLESGVSMKGIDDFIENLPSFGSVDTDTDVYQQALFW